MGAWRLRLGVIAGILALVGVNPSQAELPGDMPMSIIGSQSASLTDEEVRDLASALDVLLVQAPQRIGELRKQIREHNSSSPLFGKTLEPFEYLLDHLDQELSRLSQDRLVIRLHELFPAAAMENPSEFHYFMLDDEMPDLLQTLRADVRHLAQWVELTSNSTPTPRKTLGELVETIDRAPIVKGPVSGDDRTQRAQRSNLKGMINICNKFVDGDSQNVDRHEIVAALDKFHGRLQDFRAGYVIASPYEPWIPRRGRIVAGFMYTYFPHNRFDGEEITRRATGRADFGLYVSVRDDMQLGFRLPVIATAPDLEDLDREEGIGDASIKWRWWLTRNKHLQGRPSIFDMSVDVEATLPTGKDSLYFGAGSGDNVFLLKPMATIGIKPYARAPRFHARVGYEFDFEKKEYMVLDSMAEVDVSNFQTVLGMMWNYDGWRREGLSDVNLAGWVDFEGRIYNDPRPDAVLGLDDTFWYLRLGAGVGKQTGECGSPDRCGTRHFVGGELGFRLDRDETVYSSVSGSVNYHLTW